jgi:ATP-dependent Clp protease ATP-binding subunit ClpB
MDVVRGSFKPEFLNRIDDIVLFNPLGQGEITSIVDLLFADLSNRLLGRRITLTLDESAKSWLSIHGFDPAFGARPLRRLMQKAIGDRIATMLLSNEIIDGDGVMITATSDVAEHLDFRVERNQ